MYHQDDDDLYNDMFLSAYRKHEIEEKPVVCETENENYSVYIGDFTWWTTDQDLLDTVVGVGVPDVIDIRIHDNLSNGLSKGYATITVESKISKHLMMTKLLNTKVHGVYISVHDHTEEVEKKFEDEFARRISKKDPSALSNDASNLKTSSATSKKPKHIPAPGKSISVVASVPTSPILNNVAPNLVMQPPPVLSVPPPPIAVPPAHPYVIVPNVHQRPTILAAYHPPAMRFGRPPPPFVGAPPPNIHLPPPLLLNQPQLPMSAHQQAQLLQQPPPQLQPPAALQQQPSLQAQPPAVVLPNNQKMLTKEEFEKVFTLNRTVVEQSMMRAAADAEAGHFSEAIETLVTAISLVKESQLGSDPQGIALMEPMKDLLKSIENDSIKHSRNKPPQPETLRYRRHANDDDEVGHDLDRDYRYDVTNNNYSKHDERKRYDPYEADRESRRRRSRSPLYDKPRRYSPGLKRDSPSYRHSKNRSRSPRYHIAVRSRDSKDSLEYRSRDGVDERGFYEDIRGWDRNNPDRFSRDDASHKSYRY